MTGIIYMAVNTVNGKAYVGQTRDFKTRKAAHCRAGNETHFARAIRKHGEDVFAWRVLASDVPEEQLSTHERFWIRFYGTFGDGYNMTTGGEGINGWRHSAETRAKIADANRRWKRSDEMREKVSAFRTGRKSTPETRAKISASGKGRKHSAETRAKMSASHIGGVRSAEMRRKISVTKKRAFATERHERHVEAGQQFLFPLED